MRWRAPALSCPKPSFATHADRLRPRLEGGRLPVAGSAARRPCRRRRRQGEPLPRPRFRRTRRPAGTRQLLARSAQGRHARRLEARPPRPQPRPPGQHRAGPVRPRRGPAGARRPGRADRHHHRRRPSRVRHLRGPGRVRAGWRGPVPSGLAQISSARPTCYCPRREHGNRRETTTAPPDADPHRRHAARRKRHPGVVDAGAQPLVGALAIDERQGDQWGWAVDYGPRAPPSQLGPQVRTPSPLVGVMSARRTPQGRRASSTRATPHRRRSWRNPVGDGLLPAWRPTPVFDRTRDLHRYGQRRARSP